MINYPNGILFHRERLMSTVIVSGALANKPFNGGNAWSRLSWVLGLRRRGFEVFFVEEISAAMCLDAAGAITDFRHSVNVDYFRTVMNDFGLGGCSSLICDGGKDVHGVPIDELTARAKGASFLFNISGHLTHPELKNSFGTRVYYDDDPGFTRFWHASGNAGARLDGHDFYFSLGANIGTPECVIPTGGLQWRPTRPPVVLEHWPVSTAGGFDRFTTVASWRVACRRSSSEA